MSRSLTTLMCREILQQICLLLELYSMTHGYATQARCFHVKIKYTHRPILYTHTTMRYRCEILNHGIHGHEVWLQTSTSLVIAPGALWG